MRHPIAHDATEGPGRRPTDAGGDRATGPGGGLTKFGRALRLIGDQWNLLVVREVFSGTRRFSDFKKRLGISDAVLSGRLSDLVHQGVLIPVQYTDRPPRSEYRLTDQGLDLWPVFVAIWVWENRWAPHTGPAPALWHTTGEHRVSPLLACGSCGAIGVTVRDTEAVLRPDTTINQSSPSYSYRRSSTRTSAESGHLHPEVLNLLGDRWSVAILGGAMLGLRRFGEFQDELGISPILLSDRLSQFVSNDVMTKTPVVHGARRHEYRLRPKGTDLMPLFTLTNDWGSRWFEDPNGDALTVIHKTCGEPLLAHWVCDVCEVALQRKTIRYDLDPSEPVANAQ